MAVMIAIVIGIILMICVALIVAATWCHIALMTQIGGSTYALYWILLQELFTIMLKI